MRKRLNLYRKKYHGNKWSFVSDLYKLTHQSSLSMPVITTVHHPFSWLDSKTNNLFIWCGYFRLVDSKQNAKPINCYWSLDKVWLKNSSSAALSRVLELHDIQQFLLQQKPEFTLFRPHVTAKHCLLTVLSSFTGETETCQYCRWMHPSPTVLGRQTWVISRETSSCNTKSFLFDRMIRTRPLTYGCDKASSSPLLPNEMGCRILTLAYLLLLVRFA